MRGRLRRQSRALRARSGEPLILRALTFDALYYPDLLRVVNPHGDVGLVTMWSPWRTVDRKLREVAPEVLDPARSRVAVVANLYGDGMHAMFCNLLYNPQVRHLVAIGERLGLSTTDEIEAFLRDGIEDDVVLGKPVKRVRGTQRIFPAVPGFDDERLRRSVSFRYLGKLSQPALGNELRACLGDLPHEPGRADRVRVDIPMSVPGDYSFQPSEARGHQVVRARPLDCWQELVVRTVRFGRPVTLSNGPRIELPNAKVVISDPAPDPREALAEFGFDLDRFERYQRRMLDPGLPDGISYTYGNRLRSYFGVDALAAVADVLRENPESRRAYVSLWDTSADLAGEAGDTPCLVTLFFRRSPDGRLALSATYRSHNLAVAWLENVYGLMAIQSWVAGRVGMPVGPITVLSHSLGLDPRSPRYEIARGIADAWKRDDDVDRTTGKYSLREDPSGYFVVSIDEGTGTIIAEHRYGGVLVKRYESPRAVAIEQEVAADMAISLVSHAMWLGRELTAKEHQLRARERA